MTCAEPCARISEACRCRRTSPSLSLLTRRRGVRSTYDLHGYRNEKRRALELWAAPLKEIVEPAPGGNVVRLAGAKQS
jgi:hypothetical protein